MRSLVAGALCFVPLALAGASEWPAFRGDPSNAAWVDLGPLPAPAAPWVFRPSEEVRSYAGPAGVYSSAAVAEVEGRAVAVVGCYDHNVYALDVATAAERWRFPTGGPVFGTPCVAQLASGPAVFVGSSDRTLYALDARDGGKLWARQLVQWRASVGRASLASPALFEIGGQPAVLLCSWVYDRSAVNPLEEASASAFGAETGRLLWKVPLGTSALASPAVFAWAGRTYAVVGGADGKVWCLDLKRAKIVWRHVLRGEIQSTAGVALPEAAEGRTTPPVAVIGTRYGQLHVLDALSGRELHSFRARRAIDSSPAIAEVDGVLTAFFGSHDQSLYAMAVHTGDLLWRFHTKGDIYGSPAVFHSGSRQLVAFTSGDDRLYLLDAQTGSEVWSTTPGRYLWGYRVIADSIWSSPIVVRLSGTDVLLLPFYDGGVHAYPIRANPQGQAAGAPAYGQQMAARAAVVMVGTLVLCLWLARRRDRGDGYEDGRSPDASGPP